jgi:hypothetical protein
MHAFPKSRTQQFMAAGALLLVLAATTGCGLVVNLIHASMGHVVPPDYEGLVAQRVAVVCVADSSSFGPRPISETIAQQVTQLLAQNVSEIQLIEQQEIEKWTDEHDWNQIDYLEIGHGVAAQKLVAIDLVSFSLHEGQTMYKGRAEVDVKVYDLATQGIAYQSSPIEVQFPKNAGYHTTDITEREFQNRFVQMLSNQIARRFYSYEFQEDFARDPTIVAN